MVRTGAASDAATPGSASQGGGSHGDLLCPGTFEVEDDDRVGNLRVPPRSVIWYSPAHGQPRPLVQRGPHGRGLRRRDARLGEPGGRQPRRPPLPGTFEVEDDDRVGNLRIPAGEYQITLLGGNLTCATAERYFGIFLDRPTGRLPRKWTVLPMLAEFFKQSSHHGFRIKEVL